ncbi:glycoside hydrolase family 95 protein [Streptomyces sp. P6-2-1]|uniref:glycoside hydrolase family 95 protein n=1 Tax=Streptomyces sp. P6-2-1 TaxID=3422591 RepID=UPI003D36A98E
MPSPKTPPAPAGSYPSRRGLLAAGAGAFAAMFALPAFTARAAEPPRPGSTPAAPEPPAPRLWYSSPADDARMIKEGLPLGNGRLGALVGSAPARELLHVTDGTLWTGGRNDVLDQDGQFPYGREDFGSFTQLALLTVTLEGHAAGSVSGYRRELDLGDGVVRTRYTKDGTTYAREVYASHPDDVIVLHLTREGKGTHSGRVELSGTHGETTGAHRAEGSCSFTGSFANGLRYAAAVSARSTGGTVTVTDDAVVFTDCPDLTVVLCGGTDYAPDAAHGFRDPAADPHRLARRKVLDALRHDPRVVRDTHIADHRRLFGTFDVSLGTSSRAQRGLDTWARLRARAAAGAAPDPELEATYLQYGRYLMIAGSRDSLPLGLQGLWLDGNDPDWMGDYHTDINVQMNYWPADRAGLPGCFDALTDYCLSQLPVWTEVTARTFDDPRNRFRNSSGKVAGWAVAFSTNIHGGSGWWWHPAANAWLCNTLFAHYEYTQDRATLARIFPLLKGACEFWESRLVTTTVDDPATGRTREVLVDDKDWSPEHGPQDTRGNTYAQELVHALFGNYARACAVLRRERRHARTVTDLRNRLYLPRVSPTTGWLEEWMSPDNLGETTHRHLSPLIGLFPGDRVHPAHSSPELIAGVRALLTARGMDSYGWANAWRALCWARLGEAETAYRLIATNLAPSSGTSNGTAPNLFDIYQADAERGIFQIDANLGTPTAMLEMLLYSRPGRIELLPALPAAWAEGHARGLGARGAFSVDMSWSAGEVTRAVVRSTGGTAVTVAAGRHERSVRLRPGRSVTLTFPGR